MSLPAGVRRITHHGMRDDAPPGTSLVVLARFEGDLPDGVHAEYTVEVYTPEGILVDRMEGYRMVKTGDHRMARVTRDDDASATGAADGPAPAAARPGPVEGGGRVVESVERGEGDWELSVRRPEGADAAADPTVTVGELRVAHVEVQAVADRLEDPVYRARTFTEAERDRLDGFAVAKRRADHAAGLVAAKEALRQALLQHGIDVGPERIEVAPDERTRAPRWSIVGGAQVPRLHLSISHSNGHAVAAAVPDDEAFGVGVDVELVAARARGFADTAFVPEEQRLAQDAASRHGWSLDEVVTRFWCVKEASLKGLGTGLAVDLHDVRIEGIEADGAVKVRLVGDAALEAARHGPTRLVARAGPFVPGFIGASARITRA